MVDFTRIHTYPISQRINKFSHKDCIPVTHAVQSADSGLHATAQSIVDAKKNDRTVIFGFGGAVIKEGCSLLIIDLMRKGFIDHVAVNGAVSIHDFELALIGETSENVEQGLERGTFGMVEETGRFMNDALKAGDARGWGYGRSIGEWIAAASYPFRDYSIFYHAHILNIPVTVHIAIGGDIIHQHPSCDGAVLGSTSFEDFKKFTDSVAGLSRGVLLNIGSAVILPEVFLKALTIARNLDYDVKEFTTANFDFLDMYRSRTRVVEWPKTLSSRGYDIRGRHAVTIPALHALLVHR